MSVESNALRVSFLHRNNQPLHDVIFALGRVLAHVEVEDRAGLNLRCVFDFALPQALMRPLGYIIQQHSVRLSRPVKAYDRWVNRVPGVYRESVLQQSRVDSTPATDLNCPATLKHYRSLIPMAQEARKPIFRMTPADGAIGSHAFAVQEAFSDFQTLAEKIIEKMAAQPQLALGA